MGLAGRLLGTPAATPHDEALTHARDGVAIYWRPHCPFSIRLRRAVHEHRDRAAWVNFWKDAEGAAYVRSVNHGNETVPTVVIDGVAHPNPSPALVLEALTR